MLVTSINVTGVRIQKEIKLNLGCKMYLLVITQLAIEVF